MKRLFQLSAGRSDLLQRRLLRSDPFGSRHCSPKSCRRRQSRFPRRWLARTIYSSDSYSSEKGISVFLLALSSPHLLLFASVGVFKHSDSSTSNFFITVPE